MRLKVYGYWPLIHHHLFIWWRNIQPNFDRVVAIMPMLSGGSIEGVGSFLVLTEVLVHPLRTGNLALAQNYENVLLNSLNFQLIPVDASVARRAAHLRTQYNLRTPDALHIATALVMGCDAFLTNDAAFKRVQDIPILVLDEIEF